MLVMSSLRYIGVNLCKTELIKFQSKQKNKTNQFVAMNTRGNQ